MKKTLLIITAVIGIGSAILFLGNKADTTTSVTENKNPPISPFEKGGLKGDLEIKKYVPDVIVKDLEGKDIELKTLVNGKLTLLVFWATWCPSCCREVIEMEQYLKKYKDKGLSIIAFSVDKDVDDVIKFKKEKNLTSEVLMSNDELIAAYGGMRSIPVTFLLEHDGQIKNKIIGFNPKIEEEIKKYLGIE
ncbi:MAG: redoxin domain-containing protein [bacterium]